MSSDLQHFARGRCIIERDGHGCLAKACSKENGVPIHCGVRVFVLVERSMQCVSYALVWGPQGPARSNSRANWIHLQVTHMDRATWADHLRQQRDDTNST